MVKRTKARHFHDKARIRGGKDHSSLNLSEPWEYAYAKKKYGLKKITAPKKRKTKKKENKKTALIKLPAVPFI